MSRDKIIEKELIAIKEICKDKSYSKEGLLHRAKLLYFINRLDFATELPLLLDIIQYESTKNNKRP